MKILFALFTWQCCYGVTYTTSMTIFCFYLLQHIILLPIYILVNRYFLHICIVYLFSFSLDYSFIIIICYHNYYWYLLYHYYYYYYYYCCYYCCYYCYLKLVHILYNIYLLNIFNLQNVYAPRQQITNNTGKFAHVFFIIITIIIIIISGYECFV